MQGAKIGVIASAVLAVATMASAQAMKTDFSGSWTPDTSAMAAPPSGAPTGGAPPAGGGAPPAGGMAGGGGGGGGRGMTGPMTVKQTADTLTVESEGRGGGMQTRVYKLDGTESDMQMGQMTAKVSAKWVGATVVITTKTEQGEQTQTWSMANNMLTIDRTGGRGPSKTVYKKGM